MQIALAFALGIPLLVPLVFFFIFFAWISDSSDSSDSCISFGSFAKDRVETFLFGMVVQIPDFVGFVPDRFSDVFGNIFAFWIIFGSLWQSVIMPDPSVNLCRIIGCFRVPFDFLFWIPPNWQSFSDPRFVADPFGNLHQIPRSSSDRFWIVAGSVWVSFSRSFRATSSSLGDPSSRKLGMG